MNYYRRWIGAYRKKTGTLSQIDHGTYNLILDEYYAQDGVIPRHLSELNELCKAYTKAGKESVMKIADKYFPADDAGIRHNKRADEEIKKAKKAIADMTKGGIIGAKKRWGNP